jgi:hypothetical protein
MYIGLKEVEVVLKAEAFTHFCLIDWFRTIVV